MQFEIQLGTDYSTVTFYNIKVKWDVIAQMMSWFERLGGTLIETNVYQFPSFITIKVIEEVIHNTCFVCGGLMKDGAAMVDQEFEFEHDIYGTIKQQVPGYAKQVKVRKCESCGHSHT